MKSFIITCFCALLATISTAQKEAPVTWDFNVTQNKDNTYTLTATAKMKGEWAVYSQHTAEGGPVPLQFTYDEGVVLDGETKEDSQAIKKMSELFEVEVIKYKKEAVFTQKFTPKDGHSSIKGKLKFMCCDSERCLPPTDVAFDVAI